MYLIMKRKIYCTNSNAFSCLIGSYYKASIYIYCIYMIIKDKNQFLIMFKDSQRVPFSPANFQNSLDPVQDEMLKFYERNIKQKGIILTILSIQKLRQIAIV